MADFFFSETAPVGTRLSAKLGAAANTPFAEADKGKAVKLGTAQNYVLATGGDDIEGFVSSVEPITKGGFSFGGVQIDGWKEAVVGANQGGTPMAVKDYVVADTQVALGTAGAPTVKTGVPFSQSGTTPFAVTPSTPTKFFWRCLRILSGTGVAGDSVLLYRC